VNRSCRSNTREEPKPAHLFDKGLQHLELRTGEILASGLLKCVAAAILPTSSGWVCGGEPFSSPAPARFVSTRTFEHISIYMKAKATETRELEPVGIVISRGLRTEPAPMILAFEWGPAPELPASQDHKAA
jgi:hypothetical protein